MASTPQFTWESRAQRYRRSDGRFVPRDAVHTAVAATIQSGQGDFRQAGLDLQSGVIDLSTWQERMARLIKVSHLGCALVAIGGKANLTPQSAGLVGSRVRSEYQWLAGFANELRAGDTPMDARFLARCASYAAPPNATFAAVERKGMEAIGMGEERRVLGNCAHCNPCVAHAAKGWQPIGELPGIGQDCDCHGKCRCRLQYRRSSGAAAMSAAADSPTLFTLPATLADWPVVRAAGTHRSPSVFAAPPVALGEGEMSTRVRISPAAAAAGRVAAPAVVFAAVKAGGKRKGTVGGITGHWITTRSGYHLFLAGGDTHGSPAETLSPRKAAALAKRGRLVGSAIRKAGAAHEADLGKLRSRAGKVADRAEASALKRHAATQAVRAKQFDAHLAAHDKAFPKKLAGFDKAHAQAQAARGVAHEAKKAALTKSHAAGRGHRDREHAADQAGRKVEHEGLRSTLEDAGASKDRLAKFDRASAAHLARFDARHAVRQVAHADRHEARLTKLDGAHAARLARRDEAHAGRQERRKANHAAAHEARREQFAAREAASTAAHAAKAGDRRAAVTGAARDREHARIGDHRDALRDRLGNNLDRLDHRDVVAHRAAAPGGTPTKGLDDAFPAKHGGAIRTTEKFGGGRYDPGHAYLGTPTLAAGEHHVPVYRNAGGELEHVHTAKHRHYAKAVAEARSVGNAIKGR